MTHNPLSPNEVGALLIGSLLDDAAERMTAIVERIADPPKPSYRNHAEEIDAALNGTHHSYRVSDQEALLNANQHEIQVRSKW